ncbi:MAG: N-(5'-phosphoribosyl)anthranilate isomerase [Pelagibacteraceae bacterium BACL20 MAG-120920-bin64]|jgi:phosphoribosylanthranilate isomerase|uniref:phosphoribosylanthranilate isomerase n=1 Tax=Candidatus Pelagibacter sp. TaxID=2024849 RepID=UPI000713D58F|nr:MAG: N-(5'-phosphoribosyl)anthranilate isomerase [Pelagibacteraceae bacterium BACL20 MAG-120920-bin64]
MKSKICGISDSKTLEHLTKHSNPPQYIGFIVNYPKSKRFVQHDRLKELLKVDKKDLKYVAVLVQPDENILEEIKDLPFDYYQIYDCTPIEIKSIKEKYNKKIIIAITIKDQNDVVRYLEYNELADIILFDSKGYEKSLSFDHQLIKNLKINKELMLAGNIQIEDNLENYKEIADIIDISGGLETSGLKDISKINIFLNKVKQINDET